MNCKTEVQTMDVWRIPHIPVAFTTFFMVVS
jgi:hypothetical protein